jgi:hypothetical protein
MATRVTVPPNLPILSDASLLALRSAIMTNQIVLSAPDEQVDEERLSRVLKEIEREILSRGMVGAPWWSERVQDLKRTDAEAD